MAQENVVQKRGQTDKLPPQNIEAERSLLGSLMLDKDAITKIADILEVRDFYKPAHQKIYATALELFERSEPIDLLSISSRLKEKNEIEAVGSNAYLTELINSVPTAAHVMSYAKIIQKKRILRDLIAASYDIGLLGYNEAEDPEVLVDQAEAKIFSIAQRSLSHNFIKVKEMLEETFERYDRLSRKETATRGVPTGFADLDSMLSGFQNADLIILAARPSMGKSALAMDIARRVAINHKTPVGVFSLEMSKDQLVDRLVASQANVDSWRLRTGHFSSQGADNDFVKIQEAMGVLADAPVFIDDTSAQNVLSMRAMARRLQATHGLGLIVVDYLQLINPRNTMAGNVQQTTRGAENPPAPPPFRPS
ncbi:MAG: replicative DNA helicase [Candidatus Wildermuthbacteria bacterium]|nr:replicative DNA helicase [Candidatus Wildermuthbacteria bacterium]